MIDEMDLSQGICQLRNVGLERVWRQKMIDDRWFSYKSVLMGWVQLGAVLFHRFEQGFDGGNRYADSRGGAEHIAGGLQVGGFDVVVRFEGSSG